MLKQTYVSNLKNLSTNCIREYVNNTNLLAPSKELKIKAGVMKKEDGKKNPKMDFEKYSKLYKQEILSNPKKMQRVLFLKQVSKLFDVYLVCYCKDFNKCHRKPLMEIILQ